MILTSHLPALLFLAISVSAGGYNKILGLQCIQPDFVLTHHSGTGACNVGECALMCDLTKNCQAFSVADGPCQLFVFHRCSKYVRDCSCTRRTTVFVKQQPGLPPAALCPAGFANDLCGTKYRFYPELKTWTSAVAAFDKEAGFTIMSDVTDSMEMAHLNTIITRDSVSLAILGGKQLSSSVTSADGWFWWSCNSSISNGLWYSGEPNGNGAEKLVVGELNYNGLLDYPEGGIYYSGTLGECLSPFE